MPVTVQKEPTVSTRKVNFLTKLRALAARMKRGIVQDCPPELHACEICDKLDCNSVQWLNCPNRLAAAQFVQSGDQQALAELKQIRTDRDRALSKSCQVLPEPDESQHREQRPDGGKTRVERP